jgi:hypothetical protein
LQSIVFCEFCCCEPHARSSASYKHRFTFLHPQWTGKCPPRYRIRKSQPYLERRKHLHVTKDSGMAANCSQPNLGGSVTGLLTLFFGILTYSA